MDIARPIMPCVLAIRWQGYGKFVSTTPKNLSNHGFGLDYTTSVIGALKELKQMSASCDPCT